MQNVQAFSPFEYFTRLRWSLQKKISNLFPIQALALLGPGIIAAISGDDAGGIATYSTIGAKFGYQFLWLLILILAPSLVVIQIISIRLGVVTGKGLSALIREHFSLRTSIIGILALFLSNSITSISEFFGIALAFELFKIPSLIGVPLAALIVWWFIVKGTYQRVEKLFLLFSALFLSYVLASFLVGPDWSLVLKSAIIPSFQLDSNYIALFIATIATSITPYMQIYAQSSVVEKGISVNELETAQIDATLGSLLSMAIAVFIVITTAATLHPHGIEVESAAAAALALVPFAGNYASILFGIGLFGASMLAAGILPLTTSYSTCEAFGWRSGVQYSYKQAPIFYSIFTLLIILGVITTIIPGIPLIKLLIIAYVLNGLLLPIELLFILKLANDHELMGKYANGFVLNIVGIVIFAVVTIAIFLLFVSYLPFPFFSLLIPQ